MATLTGSVFAPRSPNVRGRVVQADRLASRLSEEMVSPTAAIAADEFLVTVDEGSTGVLKVAKATWLDVFAGKRVRVAGHKCPSGGNLRTFDWALVKSVDTSGLAAGDPVFLSVASAGKLVIGAANNDGGPQVGEVLSVSATAGELLLAPSRYGTVFPEIQDPGDAAALPATTGYVGLGIGAGAENDAANTLASPSFLGAKLRLCAEAVAGGSRVYTAAAAINQTGNTIMTFAAAGDSITLEAQRIAANLVWVVVANDGVALS
jgi:hypothetical protein